jgi:hypothetical protein
MQTSRLGQKKSQGKTSLIVLAERNFPQEVLELRRASFPVTLRLGGSGMNTLYVVVIYAYLILCILKGW